jgi:hypothetical protein
MAPATVLEVSTFLTARDLISARGLELRVAFRLRPDRTTEF